MLVLRPGALGDTLLTVPALRALHRRFAPLTLAAHGRAAWLLAEVGEVEKGLAFDDPSLRWLFTDVSAPEKVVAWMNPDSAAGLRNALLVAPSRPAGDEHCAQYLLNTLAPLGVDTLVDQRPLRMVAEASHEVLVHPGSGSASKNWPAQRFAETIRRLGRPIRLIVGEADQTAARAVEACFGGPLPRLSNVPLAELAARLAGCHAYLGNDSGVSHLAGLCGAHSIVLFGPTSVVVWRPLGPQVTTISFDASPADVAT
ncbi:MAG: glycosyltransferase family 9 protein, partial [Chloroflexi bacterium]|nr:glycosyltransferase family 9 protein [Chloroflexota bacterium]